MALAGLLAKKSRIVSVSGVLKPERMKENVWEAEIDLSAQERDGIDHILDQIPIAGERYDLKRGDYCGTHFDRLLFP